MRFRVPTDTRHIIALDLDGTVLGYAPGGGFAGEDEEHVTPEVAHAIRRLHAAGHEVIIATGRSVDATLPIVETLQITPEWVISCNGAVTLKRDPLATRAYRREYTESFDPSEALLRIRTKLVSARYAVELADGGFLYTEPIPAGTLPAKKRQVTFEDLLGVNASRVVVVAPDQHFTDFIDEVGSLGLTHVSYSVGHTSWLDIAPDGVTKASALEVITSRLGIDRSRVFAAGDGKNDIEMLKWAGSKGDSVAMGQAAPEVRAAANRVTGTIHENGLLVALQDRFQGLGL